VIIAEVAIDCIFEIDNGVEGAGLDPAARAVAASRGTAAHVWDGRDGSNERNPRGHDGDDKSGAFSLDGKRAITVPADKTARIWDISGIPEGDIFQGACAWLPDHDLIDIARDCGLTNLAPICEGAPPLPDPPPRLERRTGSIGP
jgi:hypothetical protein